MFIRNDVTDYRQLYKYIWIQHAAAHTHTHSRGMLSKRAFADEYPIIDAVQNPSWWFFYLCIKPCADISSNYKKQFLQKLKR